MAAHQCYYMHTCCICVHIMPRLLSIRSAWGLRGLASGDRRRTFAALRAQGWDGVEASLVDIGSTHEERRACVDAARNESMALILSAYSSWHNYEGPFDAELTVSGHGEAFAFELREIAELHTASPAASSPIVRINAHSGSDAWGESEAHDFFEAALATASSHGDNLPPVSHETHRGRYLCCPFATARLLHAQPSLRLTSDFSHWVVKCERLLDTPQETALLHGVLAGAVDHLHARIGTPQAPQVARVTDAAVQHAAERHYAWWAAVWDAREAATLSGRDATLSATVEYGPVEVRDEDGAYVGYTPVGRDLEPIAGVDFESVLLEARGELGRRFEEWHGQRLSLHKW